MAGTRMGTTEPGFLPLMAWVSPSFPVGAYAYSHGIEWAVEAGDVRNESSLAEWLRDVVLHGAGRNDAILLAAAHRAARAGNVEALSAANDLALALAPTRELHLETSQQGRSFLDTALTAWPHPALSELARDLEQVAYPIALGLLSAVHGAALTSALQACIFGFTQNLVSAALRLAPVGQTAGARILAGLVPEMAALADEAGRATLDDIASATFRADLGSCLHETQYTRLFRS